MADWSQEELEMAIRGPLTHIDLSVSDPDRSIPFYEALFEALGYKRIRIDAADFQGSKPRRAFWRVQLGSGSKCGPPRGRIAIAPTIVTLRVCITWPSTPREPRMSNVSTKQ